MFLYFKMSSIIVMGKLHFQHHYSSLQYHSILMNFDLVLKKHLILLSMLKTVVLLNIFRDAIILFLRFFFSRKFIFCNVLKVFIVTVMCSC